MSLSLYSEFIFFPILHWDFMCLVFFSWSGGLIFLIAIVIRTIPALKPC